MQLGIGTLTEILIKNKGSDIHIVTGSKPAIRVDGKIRFLEEYDKLTPEDTQMLAYGIMLDKYKKVFEEKNAVDFSIGVHNLGRFRVNVFRQRDSISMVLRYLSSEIRDITKLGLDMKVLELTKRSMGLVLVTGPTGSGKSTTLASMIQYILDN
jgi:Tfp pilus assembly protein, pilus retraction ATPase PilT